MMEENPIVNVGDELHDILTEALKGGRAMNKVCRHLVRADQAFKLEEDGRQTPTVVLLCDWGDSAPSQLLNVPRWMQRNALSGHLWREGDCEGCPCFDVKSS